MNVLVFDIETVPDTKAGRLLHRLEGLSDTETANAMSLLQREKAGHDFLPAHLQKIIAISVVLRTQHKVAVWSLGTLEDDEKDLITRFYDGINSYSPMLISWNGSGFDLPVLHYRSLIHRVAAARYWENGSHDMQFRYNNYLNRYHERHTDLMDVFAAYQSRCYAPLDEIAKLLGLPGKMGMHSNDVWAAYQANQLSEIRHYCQVDVLNTYLVYLHYQFIRGKLSDSALATEAQLLHDTLVKEAHPHLLAFVQAWKQESFSALTTIEPKTSK